MRHAVILAGGGGTRLWPASRRAKPKQFLSLGTGDESLLAATARRLAALCEDRLYVVTAADQVSLVKEDLPHFGSGNIIAEPSARNTAAALGLAAVHLLHHDPDAVMGALPSDQHISNEPEFRRVVDLAFSAAEDHDAIITVGIVPTRAETGYGYLNVGDVVEGEMRAVKTFVEKPDAKTAEGYWKSGDYLWNGGMFFTKASRLLSEIRKFMPETADGLDRIAQALAEGNGDAVCNEIYPSLPRVSIDYGVMEKTSPVFSIGGDFDWNDVGSWSALADYRAPDDNGNVIMGVSVTHDASGNIIVGDPDTVIAVAGVTGLVIVQSGDAVLVLPREKVQDVRALVTALKEGNLESFL